jgi:hypothetical protein
MNSHTMAQSPPRDTEGIYPFAGLPVRLGFPSSADFEILQDEYGTPTAVATRGANSRKPIGCAGCPGNYCPIAADRPDNC